VIRPLVEGRSADLVAGLAEGVRDDRVDPVGVHVGDRVVLLFVAVLVPDRDACHASAPRRTDLGGSYSGRIGTVGCRCVASYLVLVTLSGTDWDRVRMIFGQMRVLCYEEAADPRRYTTSDRTWVDDTTHTNDHPR